MPLIAAGAGGDVIKKIDLTGERFGRLLVIGEGEPHIQKNGKKCTRWKCICDCGNKVEVITQSLRSGLTKSCGCLQKEIASDAGRKNWKYIDCSSSYIGKRFGRLTVVGKTEKRYGNGSIIYKCVCDCGKKIDVSAKHLSDNGTRSCGCLLSDNGKEKMKKHDLGHYSCFKGTKIICLNNTLSKANKTGVRGVDFDQRKQMFHARIGCQGKKYNLGFYKTLKEAEAVRKEAEEILWNPIKDEYRRNINDGTGKADRTEEGDHKKNQRTSDQSDRIRNRQDVEGRKSWRLFQGINTC